MALRNGARMKRGAKRLGKRIASATGDRYQKWQAKRKWHKEIYKKAYGEAEERAIAEKARREARERYAPRPKRASRGPGLFDIPSGFATTTLLGETTRRPRKRNSSKRKRSRKRSRKRPRRVVYYY